MISTNKYGARIRKLVVAAYKAKKAKYECRKCNRIKVTRVSFSMWHCRSCDAQFAGGAYTFTTEIGEVANRMIQDYQKL